jgi:hypothetical protein
MLNEIELAAIACQPRPHTLRRVAWGKTKGLTPQSPVQNKTRNCREDKKSSPWP